MSSISETRKPCFETWFVKDDLCYKKEGGKALQENLSITKLCFQMNWHDLVEKHSVTSTQKQANNSLSLVPFMFWISQHLNCSFKFGVL